MKKTLVALAAFAATAAFAEATIYGTVDQHLVKGATATKLDGALSGQALGFKGSEDLSNGLKANFQVELLPVWNNNGVQGAPAVSNYQSFAGLSGDFGSVRFGQFFNQQFFNNAAGDATGMSNLGGFSDVSRTGTGTNQANSIEYTLPTLVSGLGVTVSKSMDNGGTFSVANGVVASQTYRLTYATGALNVGYAGSKSATATNGGLSDKATSLSASYDLGVAKLFANTQTYKTTDKATNFGVSVPFGAAKLNLNTGSKTVGTTKSNGWIAQGTYSLSKGTTALVQRAVSAGVGSTSVGVQHNF